MPEAKFAVGDTVRVLEGHDQWSSFTNIEFTIGKITQEPHPAKPGVNFWYGDDNKGAIGIWEHNLELVEDTSVESTLIEWMHVQNIHDYDECRHNYSTQMCTMQAKALLRDFNVTPRED